MWQAQVGILVLLSHRITANAFEEKVDFDLQDETDMPFYKHESIIRADKKGVRLISKGNLQFV